MLKIFTNPMKVDISCIAEIGPVPAKVHLWQDLPFWGQSVPKLKTYGTQNILFAFKCLQFPNFRSVIDICRKIKTSYFQCVRNLSKILPFLQLRWYWAKFDKVGSQPTFAALAQTVQKGPFLERSAKPSVRACLG
jgi:hypothetical protein